MQETDPDETPFIGPYRLPNTPLQDAFAHATVSNELREFILYYFEYIRLLLADEHLRDYVERLELFSQEEHKLLKDLNSELFTEFQQSLTKLMRETSAKAPQDLGWEELQEAHNLLRQLDRLEAGPEKIKDFQMAIFGLFAYAAKADKKAMASITFPVFEKWKEGYEVIERQIFSATAESWDTLLYYFNAYHDQHTFLKQATIEKKVGKLLAARLTGDHIKAIIKGSPTDEAVRLDILDLKFHLRRLNNYVLRHSKIVPQANATHIWRFDSESGKFHIDGKTAEFKSNSIRAAVLHFLATSEDRGKLVSWDEIYYTIEPLPEGQTRKSWKPKLTPEKQREKIHEACKGINRHIASKTGCIDFLIFNIQHIKINRKYLP